MSFFVQQKHLHDDSIESLGHLYIATVTLGGKHKVFVLQVPKRVFSYFCVVPEKSSDTQFSQ